jgi:hypothetical protein
MTTSETFFTSSGSSPPMDEPSLPPELIEALATLLADALVADIRQYPNLAEVQANQEPTVESPSGFNRRRSSRIRRPASRSRSLAATP